MRWDVGETRREIEGKLRRKLGKFEGEIRKKIKGNSCGP